MKVIDQLQAPAASPQVPIGQKARCAPEPVCRRWKIEKSLVPAKNRIPATQT
jgi:hypothetical protein